MGGDPWQQKKNIGLRFRCHAQITFKGGGTDDRIIGRDPTSTDGSHFPTTGAIRRSPRINPGRRADHNSADDATDIPRDDSEPML